jgi:hypothetical protein
MPPTTRPAPRIGRRRATLRLHGFLPWGQRTVVFNYGLGWDSTAILLRWLFEPESRDFELDQLIVITAQVGEEFAQSKHLVETYIYPLLAFLHIRTVQIARRSASDRDGIVVLSDTRHPTTCHVAGGHRLGDMLMADGTAPQYAHGRHFCAQRYKGWPIGQWLKQEFGCTPYRSVIGYNADELRRAAKAADYADIQRAHAFPLITWGWGREEVEAYVRQITGVEWEKSCCGFCPFAGGRADLVRRYRQEPAQALRALRMEHLSQSLNPRFGLFASGVPLRTTVEAAGLTAILTRFDAELEAAPWALYHVRRIYREVAPLVDRSVVTRATGTRDEMLAHLTTLGEVEVEGGIGRVSLRHHTPGLRPSLEEFFVAAPATIADKEKKCFAAMWRSRTSGVSQIALAI